MHTELLFELMPNESLIEYVLAPLGEAGVTPSERLILKITAALLKQLNADYDVRQEKDRRVRLSAQEMEWCPKHLETLYALPVPKHWPIPKRMEAAQRHEKDI